MLLDTEPVSNLTGNPDFFQSFFNIHILGFQGHLISFSTNLQHLRHDPTPAIQATYKIDWPT